jgi:hypothetical protein
MFTQAVEQLIKKNEKLIIVSAVVKEIDGNSFTASREGMADLLEVRLNSVLTPIENHLTVVPKLGSVVLLGIIENNKSDAVLLSCSEIDKVQVKQSGLEFEMSEGKFVFKNTAANLKDIIKNALNAIMSVSVPTPSGGVGALDPFTQASIKMEIDNLTKLFK